jgi:hypothetical protein
MSRLRAQVSGLLFLSVAVLAAQQPALKSGIDSGSADASVRAQDDFYQHVNGTWIARTEIPADKPAYGSFTELADRAELDVRAIIEATAADSARTPGSVPQQVGDLYKASWTRRGPNARRVALKVELQRSTRSRRPGKSPPRPVSVINQRRRASQWRRDSRRQGSHDAHRSLEQRARRCRITITT